MSNKTFEQNLKKPDSFEQVLHDGVEKLFVNKKTVLTIVGLCLVGFVIYLSLQSAQRQKNQKAAGEWSVLLKAFPGKDEKSLPELQTPEGLEKMDYNTWINKAQIFLQTHKGSSMEGAAELYLGKAQYNQKNYDQALAHFEKAETKLKPEFKPMAQENKGHVLMEQKKYKEASVVFSQLVSTNSALQPFYVWYQGVALEKSGESALALKAYQQLEKDFPSSSLVELATARIAALASK